MPARMPRSRCSTLDRAAAEPVSTVSGSAVRIVDQSMLADDTLSLTMSVAVSAATGVRTITVVNPGQRSYIGHS